MDELISRQQAIDALKRKQDDGKGDLSRFYNTIIQHDIETIMTLPSADEPSQVARDIARIVENEQDMRVIAQSEERTETHGVCLDAISRQAAIDAICNACGKIDCDKMDKCEKLQLPPANCSEFPNNSDTISRQAAIDALWKALFEYEDKTEKQFIERDDLDVGDWIGKYRGFVQNMSDIDRQVILNMPPAEPEHTCVNCGRTVNNGGWYADGRTRCPIEEHYALPKDGFCHLWEKRNVTDDDYPERRTDE